MNSRLEVIARLETDHDLTIYWCSLIIPSLHTINAQAMKRVPVPDELISIT